MKIEQEEVWALAQLRGCSFGVGSPESVPAARPANEDSQEGPEQNAPQDVRTEGEDGLQMIPTAAQAAAKQRWKKVKIFARVTAMGYSAAVRDAQVIPPIGAEGLSRRPPAGPCRLFLGPGFRLAACWNRLGETVKTRKKREKTGKKRARYGLKGVRESGSPGRAAA